MLLNCSWIIYIHIWQDQRFLDSSLSSSVIVHDGLISFFLSFLSCFHFFWPFHLLHCMCPFFIVGWQYFLILPFPNGIVCTFLIRSFPCSNQWHCLYILHISNLLYSVLTFLLQWMLTSLHYVRNTLSSFSQFAFLHSNFSEITAEGRRITKLDQILLNGNNIAIVSISNMTCLIFFKRCLFLLVSK